MHREWIERATAVFVSLWAVAAAGADYSLRVEAPASVAREGQIAAVLRGTSAKGLVGFAALLRYDPAALSLDASGFAGTVWEGSDFLSVADEGMGALRAGAVLDQDGAPPPASAVLPAGTELAFLKLTFGAGPCPGSTAMGFSGGVDDNVLADEDLQGHDTGNGLVLTGGTTVVVAAGTFIRGNAKGDPVDVRDPTSSVDIADGMFLLRFLFQAGAVPPCLDGADANDDGRVNLLDPIWVFQYLVGNPRVGPALPVPSSELGADPTSDGLGCTTPPESANCQ
ncbi:MAG: hypothetical protein HY721_32900 [Planctomycetes bacterium]|nr:hypothetical protein [Planctomycetota bacterium]